MVEYPNIVINGLQIAGIKTGLKKSIWILKLYEHHFYKADWEELDRLIEAA